MRPHQNFCSCLPRGGRLAPVSLSLLHVALAALRQSGGQDQAVPRPAAAPKIQEDTDALKMAKPAHKVTEMSGKGGGHFSEVYELSLEAAAMLQLQQHKKAEAFTGNLQTL